MRLVNTGSGNIAYQQSNYIFLGNDNSSYARSHEFIHYNMQQNYIVDRLNADYKPDEMFNHAKEAATGRKRDEDITMMLSGYDPDDKIWADSVYGDGVRLEDIPSKISTVKEFMRVLGV